MLDIFDGLFNQLNHNNHCGPLASPPPAEHKDVNIFGLFTKPFNPLFGTFKQNHSQDDNQSIQPHSDLIQTNPQLKELEKSIANLSQVAVSAITGLASQVGEIISEGKKISDETIKEIASETKKLIQNLTTLIQNQEEKKVEVPLKKPSTLHLETPTEPLTRSNSVVVDTNPPDSNSVVSNQASSSTSSFFKRAFSFLTRKYSKISSNKSLSNLSASRHSDSDGSLNSRDNPKSNLAESLASTTSNYSIVNLANSALSGITDFFMAPVRWFGSMISSYESVGSNVDKQSQSKKAPLPKPIDKTSNSDPEIHKSSGGPWIRIILTARLNEHQLKKEIPISSPRLGTPDDWSSCISNSIYSAHDLISNLGKRSSKKISTLSEKMTLGTSSSSFSFTALSSGSSALLQRARSGINSVESGLSRVGSGFAEIIRYQSSSSWKDSLHSVDLTNLTRSASNSVLGASGSLRGGIKRASSWAGGVASRGGGIDIETPDWRGLARKVRKMRSSIPTLSVSLRFKMQR